MIIKNTILKAIHVDGPWGYVEFLKAVNDETHPEYREVREWHGIQKVEVYNKHEVDLEETNHYLKDFYHSEQWNSTDCDLF